MKKIIGMFLIVGMCGSIARAQGFPSALKSFRAVTGEQDSISIPEPTLTKSMPSVDAQALINGQIEEELDLRYRLQDILNDRYLDLLFNESFSEDLSKTKVIEKALKNVWNEIKQLRVMLNTNETVIPSIQQVAEMEAEIPNLKRKIAILEAEFDSCVNQYIVGSSSSSEQLKRIDEISTQINDAKSRIEYIEIWLL